MQVRWKAHHSVKAMSGALAGAIAVAAVAGVWQAASPALALTVPVTAPGFAGVISTTVPASTVIATIDNTMGTALAAGSAVTIQFPPGTTVNAANIDGSDFVVQQFASCAGDVAGALASPGAAASGTSLLLTIPFSALSRSGGTGSSSCPGKGFLAISTSTSANFGGADIVRPGVAGIHTVTVATATDSGAAEVVMNAGLTATSLTPTSGPLAGGTVFTLTGTGFVTPSTVTFGGIAATDVVVISATMVTGKTPAGVLPGVAPVAVSNVNGTASNLTFNYGAAQPAATAPGAPTDVKATAGDGSAVVTWTAPASTSGNAVAEYSVTCNPGGYTATVLATTTSTTVYGLKNGEAYLCSVVAKNATGSSGSAAASNVVTPRAGAAPPAPGQSGTAGQAVDVNGDRWVRGINGVVMSGGGDVGAFVALIESESGFDVLAVWMPADGLYEFYLPQTPGVSTLRTLPGPLIAALGVLV